MRRWALGSAGIALLWSAGPIGRAAPQPQSPTIPPPPAFDSLAFRGRVPQNPLFPLVPGTVSVLEVRDGGETFVDSIVVTGRTRQVAGVTATVVRDVVRRAGARAGTLVEETDDWYATDTAGTVWYLGEATREHHAGRPPSTSGSWEAGVGGARAGIIMRAHPRVGDVYRQEYRRGVAEDVGRVVRVGEAVAVRAGRYTGCVTTEDWSPLERGPHERKSYCPGVGLVREGTMTADGERSELVALHRP